MKCQQGKIETLYAFFFWKGECFKSFPELKEEGNFSKFLWKKFHHLVVITIIHGWPVSGLGLHARCNVVKGHLLITG